MKTSPPVLLKSDLPLPLFIRGKVRDTYDLGSRLLVVATDRISAFDSVLPNAIPGKGLVLNRLSAFWFNETKDIIPNHVIAAVDDLKTLDEYLAAAQRFEYPDYLAGRSMLVKKAERLPFECVVRGYLAGSAWEEYQRNGTVSGLSLPEGLRESEELLQPIFTPTTKAASGHDQPVSLDDMKQQVGEAMAEEMKNASLSIYVVAQDYALTRGIIIADTKLEFGLLDDNQLILIDELLTPDSSRFWDAAKYKVGQSQPSYDKQPVRDWLVQSGWNKEPPAPPLPPDIVSATSKRYQQAYEKLTGRKLGQGRRGV